MPTSPIPPTRICKTQTWTSSSPSSPSPHQCACTPGEEHAQPTYPQRGTHCHAGKEIDSGRKTQHPSHRSWSCQWSPLPAVQQNRAQTLRCWTGVHSTDDVQWVLGDYPDRPVGLQALISKGNTIYGINTLYYDPIVKIMYYINSNYHLHV